MIQAICFFLCEICYLVFAKNWLISLNLSNLWTQSCNVCRICIDLHCFIYDNGKSISISLEFYPFCESFQRNIFWFYWFSLLLYVFYFINFYSIDFFLLALGLSYPSFFSFLKRKACIIDLRPFFFLTRTI